MSRHRLWHGVRNQGKSGRVSVALLAVLAAGCGVGLASKGAGKREWTMVGKGSGAAYAGSLPSDRLENLAADLGQAGKVTETLLLRNSKLRLLSG